MSKNDPLAAVYTTGAGGGGGAFFVTGVAVLVGVVVSGTFAGTSRKAAPDSGWAMVRLRAVLSAGGLLACSLGAQANNATVASMKVFIGPLLVWRFRKQQNLCKLRAVRSSPLITGSSGTPASAPAASSRAG